MRFGALLVTCALVALLGSGCTEDEPEPVAAADLPDNLCGVVPDNVVARWNLAEEDHHTDGADDRREASCTMRGAVDDVPVTLDLMLTSFGGADADAVRTLVADEITHQCRVLQGSTGRFEQESTRCSNESAGAVAEVSRSIPSQGVVMVTMTHEGAQAQLLGAEVVGLSGVVANSEPDDLG